MSGPSTPPRRTLPWQQRRPVSSQRPPNASLTQSPPQPGAPQQGLLSTQPGSPSSSQALEPPPAFGQRTHRHSVSSLSQLYSNSTNSSPLAPPAPIVAARHGRSSSGVKSGAGTFAPQFIKSPEELKTAVRGIAGESSDFSGRRFVWVRDPEQAFIKGEVLEDNDGQLTVRCPDGSVSGSCGRNNVRVLTQCRTGSYTKTMWTKSIRQSLTKPMTWLN